MNNNEIDKLLDGLQGQSIPPADANAKKQAIKQASEIFRQGFERSTRPIDEPAKKAADKSKSIWGTIMDFLSKPNENRAGYHAFGTAAAIIAVLSVILFSPVLFKPKFLSDGETIVSESETNTNTNSETPAQASKPTKKADNTLAVAQAPNLTVGLNAETIAIDSVDTTLEKNTGANIRAVNPHSTTLAKKDNRNLSDQPEAHIIRKEHIQIEKLGQKIIVNEELAENPAPTQAAPTLTSQKNYTATAHSQKSHIVTQAQGSPTLPSLSIAAVSESIYQPQPSTHTREEFAKYQPNSIKFVADTPISTFSIDVDTASYSLIRNQLNHGHLPAPQAVRVEELINYFNYDYPLPRKKSQPFASNISTMDSPWNTGKRLIHIGIKGYDVPVKKQPNSNIVFLLDVSGSMNQANKLPLVKQSVNLMLDALKPNDTVSIVVYAGAAGAVLEPTKVKEKAKILNAIRNLSAGGSTAGGAGIRLAYQLAEQHFNKDAINRIILATDGDFNIGQQSNEDLKTLVERKRESGVFLSILGFGRGNYQDDMMQTLAHNGNGVAAYIDTLSEAKKVLLDEATSTLFTIAKDVKLQVEFNPATVHDYRLVGYETRALKKEDFNNDKVDAGDIGSGHTVTAIYEITPRDANNLTIDRPRYMENQTKVTPENNVTEYGFLKIRYKLPDQSTSRLIESPITINNGTDTNNDINSQEARFSVAVAGFGQLLANSKHTGNLSYDDILKTAKATKGKDEFGYRAEFINLVSMAKIAQP